MSSPYSISAGYAGGGRIPTASGAPPIVQRQARKPPPRAAPAPRISRVERDFEDSGGLGGPAISPYGVSSVAKRLIPTASGVPPVREIKKARVAPRVGGRGPPPSSMPPPGMYGHPPPHPPGYGMPPPGYGRPPPGYGMPHPHFMQAQWGAPLSPWGPPPPSFDPEPKPAAELEPPPAPLRFELPEGSFLAEGGILASGGVAVYTDKRLSNLTGSAAYILSDLVGDVASEVQLQHDADNDQFPEIAQALKELGQDEASLTVAFCHAQGVWAVGCSGNWKKRETVAKLALCVALVDAGCDGIEKVLDEYPDFAEYATGVVRERKPKKAAKPAPKKAATVSARSPVMPTPVPVDANLLPRDVPLWIRLPEGEPTPVPLDGLASEALAVCTDGTKRKGLYSSADRVLTEIVGDIEAEIQFHDDCNWEHFPTVGAALKELSDKEECMCIAVCPSRMAWAVGVGMKGKARYQAAKAAIATTLHLQAAELGEALPEMSDGSAILDFVSEASVAKEEAGM